MVRPGRWDVTADIAQRPLWNYAPNAAIYQLKCPGDRSYADTPSGPKPPHPQHVHEFLSGGFAGGNASLAGGIRRGLGQQVSDLFETFGP